VAALRALGHEVVMLPLYLPLTLDETDQSAGRPGILQRDQCLSRATVPLVQARASMAASVSRLTLIIKMGRAQGRQYPR